MRITSVLALALVATVSSRGTAQLVDKRENWGLTLGTDMLLGRYDPDRGRTEGLEYAYSSRAYGGRINVGVVFLKHILAGGDAGAVFFHGDRTFNPEGVTGGYEVRTTNSLVSSLYIGLISTPVGRTDRVGRKFWFGGLVGKGKWAGRRELVGCDECIYRPLPMRSGPYIEPFVVLGGGDREGGGGFRFAFRKYISSWATIRDEFSVGLYFAFLKL